MKDIINEEYMQDFLLECVASKAEEPKQLTQMLKDISYLDEKECFISKTTFCEILDCEKFEIVNSQEKKNLIIVDCKLPYIMQTFINKEFIWRIQAVIKCTLLISNNDNYDWNIIKNAINTKDLLKYKDVVEFRDIEYEDVECECLYC